MKNKQKLTPEPPFAKVSGILCGQTPGGVEIIGDLVRKERIKHVVEIGTGRGGLTLYISQWAKVSTWDIAPERREFESAPKVDIYETDALSAIGLRYIEEILGQRGKKLLICDGGNKAQEARVLAKFLKDGDFLAIHDFGLTRADFEEHAAAAGWPSGIECAYGEVPALNREYAETRYSAEGLANFWGIYRKEGGAQ